MDVKLRCKIYNMESKNKSNLMKSFICVNCGNRVKELFKYFSPSIIKILECEICHKAADKYIEFEPTIIFMDVILLSTAACRHVLFNTNFKLLWKLALVLLLLESFAVWRQRLSKFSYAIGDVQTEKEFYICCLEKFTENVILFGCLYFLFLLIGFFQDKKHFRRPSFFINSVKAMTIANLAKFFMLPIMIWKDNTTDFGCTLHYIIIMFYYFLSFVRVQTVVSSISAVWCMLAVFSALFLKEILTTQFISHIERFIL